MNACNDPNCGAIFDPKGEVAGTSEVVVPPRGWVAVLYLPEVPNPLNSDVFCFKYLCPLHNLGLDTISKEKLN